MALQRVLTDHQSLSNLAQSSPESKMGTSETAAGPIVIQSRVNIACSGCPVSSRGNPQKEQLKGLGRERAKGSSTLFPDPPRSHAPFCLLHKRRA